MSRVFFGWQVVAAAFTIAVLSWGAGFYGPPIFLEALHTARGWPLPLVSAAITVHFLLGAAIVARLAGLHRRFGVARVTQAGAVLTAIGLLGWGSAREPWQLFLAMPFSGAGWALTSGPAINAMVTPWFERRRPAALGMAFNGASMGGVVFSPLWVALIGALGMNGATLLIAAVLVATMCLLAQRFLSFSPTDKGVQPDGGIMTTQIGAAPADAAPLGPAFRDRRSSTMIAATTLGLFAQIGLVSQLFALLAPRFGESAAGLVMGLATACAIVGRTAVGRVLPPGAGRRTVGAANLVLQAVGSIVLLSSGSLPMVLLGCVLFGLGLGNVTSLPPLIAQAEFRRADVARVVGLVTAVSQAGYAFAPLAFALIGTSGGRAGLFGAAAAIQVAAAVTLLLGLPSKQRSVTALAPPHDASRR